jgi:tetratricopeptide (TPR) repeat protein
MDENIRAAYSDLSMAIALDSSKLEYYFAMADLSLKGGSVPAAVTAYNQLLRRDPKNTEAILKLSKVYYFDRDYSNSLVQLAKAEELDKKNGEIWFIRGLNLKEMQDTVRALSAFQRAVTLKPDFYEAYIQLGLLAERQKSQVAAQYYDNAIRIDPQNPEAYYNKAKFLQDRGEAAFEKADMDEADLSFEKAKSVYRELIGLDPQYEHAYFNTGFILIRQDSLAEAFKLFDFAIKIKPYYAEAYYYRGLITLQQGNKEQAQADFRQALALKPDYELAENELSELE